MRQPLKLRVLTEEEERVIHTLVRSRTASVRLVERARIVEQASLGKTIPEIAATLHVGEPTVRKWFKRFGEQGLAGLEDAPRSGAPPTYTIENRAVVLEVAATAPSKLNQPFHCWSLKRLQVYLKEEKGLTMKQSRIRQLLHAEGLRWRKEEGWFGERLDPQFAEKRGPSNG
ncbi:MAG TPA: helix-turn-helix domain-containing protein [Ktedonobacteraceae bacterium]|nr:helix-turn-helix domain-containing protein [Ktedonobacteraceae bacterium]